MFASNPWSIGPFKKFFGNPVLSPTAGAWDEGIFSGGVHNGDTTCSRASTDTFLSMCTFLVARLGLKHSSRPS